ncbi:MAG TPA: alpha-amylase family glycosyl hydrolase [Polyangiaceae bacterium]|jgi:glycosidase
MTPKTLRALAIALALGGAGMAACGSDKVTQVSYGNPPDASLFDTGNGGSSPYGGDGGTGTTPPVPEAGPPVCSDADKLCAETFTYPFNGETSVELRGSFAAGAWVTGVPMTHSGSVWTVSTGVPWNQPVEYKFYVDGTTWETNPMQPMTTDDAGDMNNLAAAITCPNDYTCATPPVPPAGVFDWRDAVIYFVFVDRFFDGDPSNNCSVSGSSTGQYTSANYLGGDWAGVTQKITSGYFTDLGVNTLWITVPVQNADAVTGAGELCNSGACAPDQYEFSAYHGYWPTDPTSVEKCFGSPSDLQALVTAAHTAKLKVLFDYAMVDVHTSAAIYKQHVNDSPSWFTPFCQCGDTNDGCSNYNDYKCWFAPYLAHFDFTNSSAARTYSVNAALGLIQTYGNDAFRLDAIKQVDPSWLASLRPQTTTYESQAADGGAPQRFYMVGETYDFDDMAYIRSFINPATALDGQFDFPLRYRIVDAILLRDTGPMLQPAIPDGDSWEFNQPAGMQGLASFMDFNDSFYPVDAVMSTFIGNHDLPRSIHYAEQTLPSWLGGNAQDALTSNGSGNAWTGEPAPETDPNTFERLGNAFGVLLTNKGAPLIYYGDEIGLPGAGDPDNRRMMQWTGYSPAQQALYARIKALTTIRAAHPAMRRGTRSTVEVTADLWVYELTTLAGDPSPDTVYVGINRSDGDLTTTMLPSGLTELITNTPATGTVTIPARETRIFH